MYGYNLYLTEEEYKIANASCPKTTFRPATDEVNANGFQWVVYAGDNRVYVVGPYNSSIPEFDYITRQQKPIIVPISGTGGQATLPWAGKLKEMGGWLSPYTAD